MFGIKIKIERWKFNKEYQIWVSSLGNFKNKYKKPMKLRLSSSGYFRVGVTTGENKRTWKLAHRIIMETFKGKSEMTIDHLDRNRRNNELSNLEYVTEEENLNRANAAEDWILEKSEQIKIILESKNLSTKQLRKIIDRLIKEDNGEFIVEDTPELWFETYRKISKANHPRPTSAGAAEKIRNAAARGGRYLGYRFKRVNGRICGELVK